MARRPVTITVRIKSDDPADFELSTTGNTPIKKGGAGGDDEVTFDNWQGGQFKDGFEIAFRIQDDTGKGYMYFQDPNPTKADLNDAMAVKVINANGHCPRAGSTWVGFTPTGMSPDRKTLSVVNPNEYKQYFGFAFFFGLHGDSKYRLKYDPIGDNRNGLAQL